MPLLLIRRFYADALLPRAIYALLSASYAALRVFACDTPLLCPVDATLICAAAAMLLMSAAAFEYYERHAR